MCGSKQWNLSQLVQIDAYAITVPVRIVKLKPFSTIALQKTVLLNF